MKIQCLSFFPDNLHIFLAVSEVIKKLLISGPPAISAIFFQTQKLRKFRESASFAQCGRVDFISEVTFGFSLSVWQGFTAAERVLRMLSSLEVLEEVITQRTNSEEA